MQKVVQIHDSDRAIHADEGDEVMKFAQSKMKIAVAEKETKNPDGTQQTGVRLSGFPAKKTRGCADELDDLWDDVGVGSVIKRCDVSDGEDGDDKQNKKRRKAATPRKTVACRQLWRCFACTTSEFFSFSEGPEGDCGRRSSTWLYAGTHPA